MRIPKLSFLALLAAALPCAAAHEPVLYSSDFARGLGGWSVQWTGSGKLDVALDAGRPGPSGAPSLRTTMDAPSKGSTGVTIPVAGARWWRIEMLACAEATAGSASVNLQCHGADGKQVDWIPVGDLPRGAALQPIRALVRIPDTAATLNLLVLHVGMQGTTHLADVRITEFTPDPAALAKMRPQGPTRWGSTGFFTETDPRAQDTVLKLLATAGVTHTRGWIDWRKAEPEQGRYDFSRLEEQIALAERYGCKVDIVCIHGTPSWASGKSGATDLSEERRKQGGGVYIPRAFWAPRDWQRWEAFVTALATRFRGRVAAWEILNEPDLWSEGFCGTYEEYRDYLRRGYGAAKKADPRCRVFTAAFVFGKWLPMLLTDGMARYFDGVCVHPYHTLADGCASRLQGVQLTLLAAGAPRETWVTEVGFQSGGWKEGPGCLKSEAEKAERGRRALALLAESSELVCWYTGVEAGNMYGLLRKEKDRFVPMPIYYEYGALTGRLKQEDAPVKAELLLPEAPASPGRPMVVRLRATNTSATSVKVRFWPVGFVANLGPAGASPATHDWEGALAPGAAHEVEVTLTPRPEATGDYPVGLAVLSPRANVVRMGSLKVAP